MNVHPILWRLSVAQVSRQGNGKEGKGKEREEKYREWNVREGKESGETRCGQKGNGMERREKKE